MNMKKFLAMVLAVAMLAAMSAIAEAPAAEDTAVESLFGTDIYEAGAALGLVKTQDQSDEAYLTMYQSEDIMVGGRDGIVVDISLFTDKYELYGVKINMTAEEAKAALDAQGIAYTEDTIVELDTPVIEFDAPDHENAKCEFDIYDDKIGDAQMYVISNTTDDAAAEEAVTEGVATEEAAAEEDAAVETATEENTASSSKTTASKATAPKKASGYIRLTGKSHLRKSADKESKSLKIMPKDTKLKYSATAKDYRGVTWYKVKYDGKTGWVSSKYTKKIKKSEYNNSSSKATKPKKASGYITLTGKCNVRKSPDKNSKSLDVFAKGSELKYTATAKDSRGVLWYKVSADGVTGWISSKYAKRS